MPHIEIQFSANIEPDVDIERFCDALRASAAKIDTFPLPGLRFRAFRADYVSIADGDPRHGFIDISVRLRAGRPQEVKEAATEQLFEVARDFLAPVMERRSLALSLEMRDIDPAFSPKTGTIRKHLKDQNANA